MKTNDILVTVQITAMTCPTCGVTYGIDEAIRERKQRDGGTYYCTNGHSICYTTPEVAKLREQLVATEQRLEWARDSARGERRRAEAAERKAAAHKGVATKLKKRAAAGVCPCCNRHFEALARHMKSQHPGFVGGDE